MSADPTQPTTESEDSSSELSRIWRAIGGLESTAAALQQGQRELKEGQETLRTEIREGLQEARAENNASQREVHRRIDRVLYVMLGMGGALLATMLATRFIGG